MELIFYYHFMFELETKTFPCAGHCKELYQHLKTLESENLCDMGIEKGNRGLATED